MLNNTSSTRHVARLYETAMSDATEKSGEEKVKDNQKKAKRILPKSSMLKLIGQLYGDLAKSKDFEDFRGMVYDNGLNLFGLQKMAD